MEDTAQGPLAQLVGLLRSSGVLSYEGPNPFDPKGCPVKLTLGPVPQPPIGPVAAPSEEKLPDADPKWLACGGRPINLEELRAQSGRGTP